MRRAVDLEERAANTSAPMSEPMPMSARNAPNVPASPSKLRTAIRGTSTAKLNENVNTTAIRTIGSRSADVSRTYRTASRI
jgi:hypothetical protein